MPARASTPVAPPRWNVFLSSTVRDLKPWRRGVKQALDLAEVQCYPSEDWVNTWQDTEAACRQKFDSCDSYMLLLGFWYGSELPGRDRTVTQQEFEWACKRDWNGNPPPMAVLVPDDDSPAEAKLRAAARRLATTLPDDAARRRHEERVLKWHDDVRGSWKTVDRFSDLANLRERVIVIVRRWDPSALLAAARGAGAAADDGLPRLGPVDLGLLCRGEQFQALRKRRAAAEIDAAPALALLVHGDRDCGGDFFLRRLAVKELKCGTQGIGRVPPHSDLALLVAQIAQLLGLQIGADATPAALAALAASELKTQPLGFVIDDCGAFAGGIGAVESGFWRPFEAALHELHAAQPLAHRLTAAFADFSGDAQSWLDARAAVGDGERDRLQPLPALGAFDKVSLYEGFEALHIAPGRRQALAEHALMAGGKPDPLPVRALARLMLQPIEYEEDET